MTAHIQELPRPRTISRTTIAAGLATLAVVATIAGAWGFELIGHYLPCHLCLQERIPYYIGIPVAVLALVLSLSERTERLARILLLVLAALFVWSIYQGVYHAGVEWQWWAGPADCTAGATGGRGNLLTQIQTTRIVMCDSAAWRFPAEWGLSFAGWNAVISAGIVLVALYGALTRRRTA